MAFINTRVMPSVAVAAMLLLIVTDHVADAARRSRVDPCSTTDFPILCKSVVKGLTNPNAATAAAINALLPMTRKAKAIARKGRSRNSGTATCFSNFDSAIDNLEKSLQNIKENDGFSLNINLSAALTDFETCKDAMEGSPATNVMSKFAGVLRQMADNCLSLSTLVKQ